MRVATRAETTPTTTPSNDTRPHRNENASGDDVRAKKKKKEKKKSPGITRNEKLSKNMQQREMYEIRRVQL